jgi:hypothetical protein
MTYWYYTGTRETKHKFDYRREGTALSDNDYFPLVSILNEVKKDGETIGFVFDCIAQISCSDFIEFRKSRGFDLQETNK